MKPKDLEEAGEWLRRARDDIRAAQVDLDADPALLEDVLFHCQQAAEKSLKAFLAAHGVPFPKTHDIGFLSEACKTVEPKLLDGLDDLPRMTTYAWAYRYPGTWEPPSTSECMRSLDLSRLVLTRIETALKMDA